jgi:sulfur-oxidizing protein SoxX
MFAQRHALVALACAASMPLAGAAPSAADLDRQAEQMMRASFRDEGIAQVDRLTQDESNAECARAAGKPLAAQRSRAIERANAKTIQLPADGRFVGDWKRGETLAQDGRGMTFTDAPTVKNGGNCYNCHQISKTEISFGTIGPSLYQYGKLRGVAYPGSPGARAVVEYTWGKLYNARATNACSQMPRFGHGRLLTEDQLRDLMALLLDPASPVNAN